MNLVFIWWEDFDFIKIKNSSCIKNRMGKYRKIIFKFLSMVM